MTWCSVVAMKFLEEALNNNFIGKYKLYGLPFSFEIIAFTLLTVLIRITYFCIFC